MALTRQQKESAVEEIVSILKEQPTVYLTNFSGLSVSEATELRAQFTERGVGYKVVKNTLLRRAMDDVGGFEELYDQLEGPTAIAYGIEPATPAKVIKAYAADNKLDLPELKAAFVDGAVYHADALDVLAALKSKDELIGDILGLIMAPITNVVGGLQGAGSTLVGAVKSLAERPE